MVLVPRNLALFYSIGSWASTAREVLMIPALRLSGRAGQAIGKILLVGFT